MSAKAAWVVIAVLVLAGGAYYLFSTYYAPAPTNSIVLPPQPTTATTAAPSPSAPPLASGTIESVTPSSITVATQGGGSKTFAVSASTVVKSIVAAGEVGKTLSQLSSGTVVLIFSLPTDPNTAQSVNVLPPPTPPPPGTTAYSGSVVSASASSITLTLQGGTTKKIAVNAQTQVFSNVSAGQTGKTASELAGTSVQVVSIIANGVATASLVLVIK